MRSSILLPRRRVGACSPSTHRIASTTLDFPQPFGPTTAVMPGAKPIVVESRKDLKPSNSRLLRRMLHRLHHTTACTKTYRNEPQMIKTKPNLLCVTEQTPTANCGCSLVLDKLSVPVGAVHLRQVRHPFAVASQAEHLRRKRRPFWPSRTAEQVHAGFLGRASTLAPIAVVARADDVLPRRRSAARPRDHVIEIEVRARQFLMAILAGVAVAGEDVEARESHVALGYALIGSQQQDPRHADEAVYDPEALVLDFDRQRQPAVEIKGVILLVNGLGNALIKQRKCSFYRSNV